MKTYFLSIIFTLFLIELNAQSDKIYYTFPANIENSIKKGIKLINKEAKNSKKIYVNIAMDSLYTISLFNNSFFPKVEQEIIEKTNRFIKIESREFPVVFMLIDFKFVKYKMPYLKSGGGYAIRFNSSYRILSEGWEQ